MIIVLGPGRCGSSTVARLLHNLGVSMGQYFRAPDNNNPKGYFEDLIFRDLNHAQLSGQCQHYQEKLDVLVTSRTGLFGVKDPRICNLWQWYRKWPAKYILCTRRPQLIIKSMMVSYGWSEEDSKHLLLVRLNGIDKLLEGRDALKIDFSIKREDSELTNLLQHFLRLQ